MNTRERERLRTIAGAWVIEAQTLGTEARQATERHKRDVLAFLEEFDTLPAPPASTRPEPSEVGA